MRFVITTMLVLACVGPETAAAQAPGTAAGKPAIRACSLLTREMVVKFTTIANKSVIDLIPPQEDAIGATGSSCDYGGIGLQVDPFARAETMRKSPAKDWQPVPGVGDTAFFHNNRDTFAELFVWTGNHHFTIQMGVPMGAKAESIKSNTIGLANALIPKLR